jgi:DNA-binding response OmpR family regulator
MCALHWYLSLFIRECSMLRLGDILVVENDDPIRALLIETLNEEGYAVRSASNRTDMRRALVTQSPDLLICDVDLERGPDPALIDDVRTASSEAVPLLLLTTNVWTARSLARQGLTFYLLKPFGIADLLTIVATHIRPHVRAP